ncbi:MAG TPA: NUDIX hydrolase [Firmicutes bacterium]|nr:NUDIX hydrolase [Candidatus Fermentithermobacillaceae bacterium]
METPISKRTVFKGRILSVRVDTVLTRHGRETTREIVERPDTVSVVAIDEKRNILLVRQYRYATGKYTVEIPAGTIDPGETPEQAARRELREETGYDCDNLIPVHLYWPAIGYSTEKMTIFIATGLKPAPLKGDEDSIELLRLPFSQVHDLIDSGKPIFEDAKSTIGVILAARVLAGR